MALTHKKALREVARMFAYMSFILGGYITVSALYWSDKNAEKRRQERKLCSSVLEKKTSEDFLSLKLKEIGDKLYQLQVKYYPPKK